MTYPGDFFPSSYEQRTPPPSFASQIEKAKLPQICACRGRQWLIFLS